MFPTFAFMNKLESVGFLIKNGQIKNVTDLYNFATRKEIAEILGVNPVAFSNRKANVPGKFKLEEIQILAQEFEVDLIELLHVFAASM